MILKLNKSEYPKLGVYRNYTKHNPGFITGTKQMKLSVFQKSFSREWN